MQIRRPPLFTATELRAALKSLKDGKAVDEFGAVADMFRRASDAFLGEFLAVLNHILVLGNVPPSWQRTRFVMLAKSSAAAAPGDFRPIALLQKTYKVHAKKKCTETQKNEISGKHNDIPRNLI